MDRRRRPLFAGLRRPRAGLQQVPHLQPGAALRRVHRSAELAGRRLLHARGPRPARPHRDLRLPVRALRQRPVRQPVAALHRPPGERLHLPAGSGPGRPLPAERAGLLALHQQQLQGHRAARADRWPALHLGEEGPRHLLEQHRRRDRLRHGAGPRRRHRRSGAGQRRADPGRRPARLRDVPGAVRRLQQPGVRPHRHERPASEGGQAHRHRQGRLPVHARAAGLCVLRPRLQGRRLQPRPDRHHHPDGAGPAHGPRPGHRLRPRDRGFLRTRREEHPARPDPAAEPHGLLPVVQGLPAQRLQRPGLLRRLGAKGDLARRRRRLPVVHAGRGAEPQRRGHLRRDLLSPAARRSSWAATCRARGSPWPRSGQGRWA